jgi:hypothetical protein
MTLCCMDTKLIFNPELLMVDEACVSFHFRSDRKCEKRVVGHSNIINLLQK